jgi:hypothetical protein
MYYYSNYSIEKDYKNFFFTFQKSFTRSSALEGICKIRLSKDFQIKDFYTPCLTRNRDMIMMANLDSNQSYTIAVDYQESLKTDTKTSWADESNLYIQIALLYSHADSSKRIRVINYCLSKCRSIEEYIASLNIEALTSLYLKVLINNLFVTKNMDLAHRAFQDNYYKQAMLRLVDCDKSRKMQERSGFINYLPLMVLGMVKSRLCCLNDLTYFASELEFSNYLRLKILKMKDEEIVNYFKPTIYDLNEFITEPFNFEENSDKILPSTLKLVSKSFDFVGLYLIDNGYELILYFNFKENEDCKLYLMNLFSLKEFNSEHIDEDYLLYKTDNNSPEEIKIKEKIIKLINYIRGAKTLYQNILISWSGAKNEKMYNYFLLSVNFCLIEDNYCPWFKFTFKDMIRELN